MHSTGGWAALAGMMVVGPRLGKFRKDDSARPTPPSNILVVTLGVFILWFGWFGFNGGSQLAVGSATDAVAMSIVLVNTNLAAAAGVMAALMPYRGRSSAASTSSPDSTAQSRASSRSLPPPTSPTRLSAFPPTYGR